MPIVIAVFGGVGGGVGPGPTWAAAVLRCSEALGDAEPARRSSGLRTSLGCGVRSGLVSVAKAVVGQGLTVLEVGDR